MGAQDSVADLIRRIVAFSQSGDRSAVLDQSALADAFSLFAEFDDSAEGGAGLTTSCVGAMFLLAHAQAGGDGGLPGPLSQLMAMRLLELADSGKIPESLRPVMDAVLRDMMLDSQARHGLSQVQHGADEDDDAGDLAELDEVIRLGNLLILNGNGEQRAALLAAQAEALIARSRRRAAASDRDDAIILRRQAVDEFGSGPQWFSNILSLRDQLMKRWQEEDRPADADEVIAVDVALLPELTDEERAMLLPAHIRMLWGRLNRKGAHQDLDMIIEAARQVCRLGQPPDSEDLSNLCFFLQLRYRRTRDLSDLDEAVAVGREAVQDLSANPEQLTNHLANLFGAVTLLAEATDSRDAVNEAVRVAERAARLLPSDSSENARQLANLTTALVMRFQATEDRDDLEHAITCGQQALDVSRPDDPVLDNLGASLVAALALKFRHFGDDSALDHALGVLRGGIHVSPAWLESLYGLVGCLSDRIEGESVSGDSDERRSASLSRYRQIRRALLSQVEKSLVLISTEMMGEGAAAGSIELIDGALDLIRQAAELGGEERQALYRGLRGECLIRRWQITQAREELDTAIDCLIQAATGLSGTGGDGALAAQHRESAASALLRRFRRRRHAEDLHEADRQLELAIAELPPSETELRAELRSQQQNIRAVVANPPFLLVQSDVGEADREDLSSPYEMANRSAWNEGRPRFSGLTWVHTREDEAGSASNSAAAKPSAGRRVLFLRTFLDDDTNFVMLNSLILAVDAGDRVELVGDARDRSLVVEHWQRAFGSDSRPESRVDFIESTNKSWRRDVLERMCSADAIILFVSPKDADFPEFPFLSTPGQIGDAGNWDRFMDAPLAQPLTGPGLLAEICYLNRLGRLPDTVVLCDLKYQSALDDLIALGGMMGDATDREGNLVTPKLTATDKQVGHLRKAFRGITYRRQAENETMPNLAQAVREALSEVLAEGSQRETPWTPRDLCGTSSHPRRLPPDNELKVVSFTDVENVFFIPAGEITEIDHREMRTILSPAAIETGCPYCRAPLKRMFFYARGLERRALNDAAGEYRPNAKCQVCGRKSSLFGDHDLWPQ